VVLDKLDMASLPGCKLSKSFDHASGDFVAYTSMADRIKDKKKRRMAAELKSTRALVCEVLKVEWW